MLVTGVLAVLALAGASVYFLSEWVGDRQTASASPNGAPAAPTATPREEDRFVRPITSAAGFDSFLDDLERETGSTRVVDLVVYPEYATVTVPDTSKQGRTRSLYYDGDFSSSSLGTSDSRPVDARRVDSRLVVDLSRRIRTIVDDADQWYVIVQAPDPEGATVYAYAANEYGEGGYLSARMDGTVVRKVFW